MAETNTLPIMKISALTACGPRMSLEDWMREGRRIKLDGLEVACFQAGNVGDVSRGSRIDYVADTINLDEPLTQKEAIEIVKMSKDYGVAINSLGSYDNQLHSESGLNNRNHLKNLIDAAVLLKEVMPFGPLVATFVGADPNLRMQQNYERFRELFLPLVTYAKERGARIMIENCPMEGWEASDRPVNNIMSSPGLWNACFDAADTAGVGEAFGLEYDPSHRIWQTGGRMDLVKKDIVIYGKRGKIFSLHGKGAEFVEEGLWEWGIDGKLINLPHEWAKRNSVIYEHAVPGESYDSVNWNSIIPLARKLAIPFVTAEIEDPRFKDMTDPVRNGVLGVRAIEKAYANLEPLCHGEYLNL